MSLPHPEPPSDQVWPLETEHRQGEALDGNRQALVVLFLSNGQEGIEGYMNQGAPEGGGSASIERAEAYGYSYQEAPEGEGSATRERVEEQFRELFRRRPSSYRLADPLESQRVAPFMKRSIWGLIGVYNTLGGALTCAAVPDFQRMLQMRAKSIVEKSPLPNWTILYSARS